MDSATANGLGNVLTSASHLWCTRHLQDADARKLRSLGANQRTVDRIMADIYGFQVDSHETQGLADAEDAEDLAVKLDSLREIWNDLVNGFYDFFVQHRVEIFNTCLVLSAREYLGINGHFYSNGLELLHRLLKKKLDDLFCSGDIKSVREGLTKWASNNFLEEARKALRGQGKYRLAPGFQHFTVDPVTWMRRSPDQFAQHFEAFLVYQASGSGKYTKPSDAGKKSKPGQKRQSNLPEADLFSPLHVQDEKQDDRPESKSRQDDGPALKAPLTPLKLTKATKKSWTATKSKKPSNQSSEIDISIHTVFILSYIHWYIKRIKVGTLQV